MFNKKLFSLSGKDSQSWRIIYNQKTQSLKLPSRRIRRRRNRQTAAQIWSTIIDGLFFFLQLLLLLLLQLALGSTWDMTRPQRSRTIKVSIFIECSRSNCDASTNYTQLQQQQKKKKRPIGSPLPSACRRATSSCCTQVLIIGTRKSKTTKGDETCKRIVVVGGDERGRKGHQRGSQSNPTVRPSASNHRHHRHRLTLRCYFFFFLSLFCHHNCPSHSSFSFPFKTIILTCVVFFVVAAAAARRQRQGNGWQYKSDLKGDRQTEGCLPVSSLHTLGLCVCVHSQSASKHLKETGREVLALVVNRCSSLPRHLSSSSLSY